MTIASVNSGEPARKSSVARCGNITKCRNGFHLLVHHSAGDHCWSQEIKTAVHRCVFDVRQLFRALIIVRVIYIVFCIQHPPDDG
jgi:hypothetical protein